MNTQTHSPPQPSAAPAAASKWAPLLLLLASEASAFSDVQRSVSSPSAYGLPSPGSFSLSRSGAALVLSGGRHFRTFSTRLDYADDGVTDGNATGDQTPPMITKLWSNLFPAPASTEDAEDKQEVVDDYLEFLDRRYKRLREPEEESEIKPFSAIDWLLQGNPKAQPTKQQQEDALHVLGVAGLASEKLLQKHHAASSDSLREKRADRNEGVIDVTASTAAPVASPSKIVKALLPVLRVLYIIQHRRQVFIQAYTSKLTAFRRATLRSARSAALSAPASLNKALDMFLEAGGGKKSLAMTFTVVSALFLLLRPVFQAALAEGSASM